jgi:uncharacterized membrane protein
MSAEPNTMNQVRQDEKETGRVEAFSDGVFAIAITLLILEIRVPEPGEGEEASSLVTALLELWPSYLAYLISFLTIAVMWVNHHNMFRLIRRTDNALLFLNSLLLMFITFLNFSTALLADYIKHPELQVAALVYTGTMVVLAGLWNLLWRYVTAHRHLLASNVDPALIQTINRRYRSSILYVIAFLLVFVSPAAGIALVLAMAVFFAITASTR